MQKKSKKPLAIGALAVLLVAFAVGGTIAWLTAANSVTNTFTVGEITEPTKPPTGEPDPGTPDDEYILDGNIYEVFGPDTTIIPGENVVKRPWVGIGEGSQDSFVFAYVDNKMMAEGAGDADSAYFVLNDGWAPVSGKATEYKVDPKIDNAYTGGLFVWVGSGHDATTPVALIGNESADVWTTNPVFNAVEIPDSAVADDFAGKNPTMDVWCYIIAKSDDVDGNKAIEEASAWANSPAIVNGTAATA